MDKTYIVKLAVSVEVKAVDLAEAEQIVYQCINTAGGELAKIQDIEIKGSVTKERA